MGVVVGAGVVGAGVVGAGTGVAGVVDVAVGRGVLVTPELVPAKEAEVS